MIIKKCPGWISYPVSGKITGMIKKENMERVNQLLSRWLTEIKLNNAISLYDINKYAEDLVVRLLNAIYGYNLVNLSVKHAHIPFIDLGDPEAGIAFQVTTRLDIQKIKISLEGFVKNFHKDFPGGIRFLVLSLEKSGIDRLKKSMRLKEIFPGFDPQKHIIGVEDMVRVIARLNIDDKIRFTRVLDILEEELAVPGGQKTAAISRTATDLQYLEKLRKMRFKSYPSITLKGLTLDNIRCFKHVELRFPEARQSPSWTVLVGDNGVGKTTILHAAALCALGPELASKCIPFPASMVRVGADRGYMETMFEISEDNDSPAELTIRLVVGKGSKTFDIEIDGDTEKSELVKTFIAARNYTEFDGWFVAGYGAVRNLLFTDEPSKSTRQDIVIDRVSSLFDPTKILIDPSSLYRFLSGDTSPFKELGAPPRLSKKSIDNIRILLDKLLPMIHFKETSGTEHLATDFGNVPISGLSEGYKSMLSWLTHLIVHLLRAVNWNGNINIVKGIVLIDEVDLHLHPGWQQEIIPLLRECFPNLQFIGCTHSPMTVGGVNEGDIILLEREGNDIYVEQDFPSIRGWRADQILTSPIFGLKTSRDKQTHDMLEEYKKLISLKWLSKEQEERLSYLREKISDTLPAAGETEIQREAFRIIEKTMEDYFNKQTPERKQELFEEIKRQLQR
jgi:hypothetical protein